MLAPSASVAKSARTPPEPASESSPSTLAPGRHRLEQFLHHLRFKLVRGLNEAGLQSRCGRGLRVHCPCDVHLQNLQVGLEGAGLLHRLQDRDHIARSGSDALQLLNQILNRCSFLEIDAVDRLVLRLNRCLLHDLGRSRR